MHQKGTANQLAWEIHKAVFLRVLKFFESSSRNLPVFVRRFGLFFKRFLFFKKRERLFKTINVFIEIMLLPSFILTRFVMHSGLWSLSLKHCLLFHYSAIHLQITIHQNLFLATETMPFIWERTLFWQIK